MLILQSYRTHSVPSWIQLCLDSVQSWAAGIGADYHCADDSEILASLPNEFVEKLAGRWPMLADLGRLKLAKQALENGHDCVVWLDADVLVTDPSAMYIPRGMGYAFGREAWLEQGGRVRIGVHNALCVFEQGNPFLDYYIHACERIIQQHTGKQLAPQLLGPKFLKMQYNLLRFPLCDAVAMVSPAVVDDMLHGNGALWQKQREQSEFAAVNLCGSLLDDTSGLAAVHFLKGN